MLTFIVSVTKIRMSKCFAIILWTFYVQWHNVSIERLHCWKGNNDLISSFKVPNVLISTISLNTRYLLTLQQTIHIALSANTKQVLELFHKSQYFLFVHMNRLQFEKTLFDWRYRCLVEKWQSKVKKAIYCTWKLPCMAQAIINEMCVFLVCTLGIPNMQGMSTIL